MNDLTQFVGALFQPEDLVEIRFLPTERGGMPLPESMYLLAEDIIDMKATLTKKNEAGHNLFFGVLPRRNKGATSDIDCLSGSVLWADFDKIDLNGAKEAIKDLPLPTITVNSGHGTHFYWKLTKPIAPYTLAKAVHDLAHHIKSDTSVANPSRILRMPGFTNHKPPVAEASVLECERDRVYDFTEFMEKIPNANYYAGMKKPADFGKDVRLRRNRYDQFEKAKSYVNAFSLITEGGRNHAAFSLGACLQKDFALTQDEAWLIMQDWNTEKCSPPLTDDELYSCLMSGERYGKHEVGAKLENKPVEKKRPERRELPTKPKTGSSIVDSIRLEVAQEICGTRRAIPLPWKGIEKLPLLFPGKVSVVTGLPGASKSYFALSLGRSCQQVGTKWSYTPLEDTKTYHTRRLLATVMGSWDMAKAYEAVIERKQESAIDRIMEEYEDLALRWGPSINDNPTMISGEMKAIEHLDALDMIEELAETQQVIMVDPVAQIDFVGKNEWQVQAQFMRSLIGIANRTECNIILVIHRAKKDNSGVYGVEGSKRFVDLAHTVVSIDRNQQELLVQLPDGTEDEVECNRIISIEKCRDSILEGTQWAHMFGECGPLFREIGQVVKKSSKK